MCWSARSSHLSVITFKLSVGLSGEKDNLSGENRKRRKEEIGKMASEVEWLKRTVGLPLIKGLARIQGFQHRVRMVCELGVDHLGNLAIMCGKCRRKMKKRFCISI